MELARVREGDANAKMLSMMSPCEPTLDWVSIAEGMGVRTTRAATAEEFPPRLGEALGEKGPRLVEAQVVPNTQETIDVVCRPR